MIFTKWRIGILVVLMGSPVLFLIGVGSWWLWQHPGIGFVAWWPMMLCFAAGYVLAWWWHRQSRLLPPPELNPPLYWTERDHEAWRLVEARAKGVSEINPDRLVDPQYYVTVAGEMAQELARFYHPKTLDPVGALTIPEILAVVELASHDLSEMVNQYLPGSHLLTIDHWRSAPKVRDWYNWANLAYWAVAALFNPLQTVTRYAASQIGVSQPWRMLQENLVAWFFAAYVHRVGTYLIEVNSGRLKVGAKRYRELLAQATQPIVDPTSPPAAAEPATTPETVTITVLGQVKAGKSSLINAMLGERRAATDVLPLTSEITRYQLAAPGTANRLVILDTVGYAHEGPRQDQMAATEKAVQSSDLVLFVLNARDPARQPDLDLLRKLQDWFAARSSFRHPPIVGVLTHIDLLSPMMEWAPPYDWEKGTRAKEQNVRAAMAVTEGAIGSFLIDLIPVCSAEGKVYGVTEGLLPRVVQMLGEARAVALLRCLHAEANAHKIRRILDQLLQAGTHLWRVAVANNAPKPQPARSSSHAS